MKNLWRKPLFIGLTLILVVVIPVIASGISSIKLAKDMEMRGEYRSAAETYSQTARLLFWRTDLHEQAGINFSKAGDFPAAIKSFQRTEKLGAGGWAWYCIAYIQLQEYPSAISICAKGAENNESSMLYGLLAYIYREQKNLAAEQSSLENQTRLDQTDAYAAYRLGMLLMLSAPEDAVEELNRASTLNPEVDSAVQTLVAALAVSENQSDLSMKMVIIGQAFGVVQDWSLAQQAFAQAIQLDETNAEAWVWLGEAKQQNGQDGSVELSQALRLDRHSVSIRAIRALYWNRQGKYEQMLAEYMLAAGIEPENPRWQAGMGEAYAKLGDLVSALNAYQRAVELAPTDAEYWRLLAAFCAENGVQVEEIGLPAAQQALSIEPNDPAVLDVLGYAFLSTGRFTSAEQALMQAIDLTPDYYPAHIHLAMTYLAQGNMPAAYNTLTFVRDSDGSGTYAEIASQLLDKYFR